MRPLGSAPHIIAHRGASGYLPEHTLQAYRLAMDLGADYVEPDLVVTSDGHLVCLHDVELSGTTDVADRPELAGRRRTLTVDGKQVTGWFSFDLSLSEVKSLRVKQRLRMRSHVYDYLFQVPTLEEVVQLVKDGESALRRPIGIYAEIKEPHLFLAEKELDAEAILIKRLQPTGLLDPAPPRGDGPSPLVLQCFDPHTLRSLATRLPRSSVPLVQLLLRPSSEPPTREARFGGQLSLADIAEFADGIGPDKALLSRDIVEQAHSLGLAVHPWTFRREPEFVGPAFAGDSMRELTHYLCRNDGLGVDAAFVEQPDDARRVLIACGQAKE